jgi:hypothetical protein
VWGSSQHSAHISCILIGHKVFPGEPTLSQLGIVLRAFYHYSFLPFRTTFRDKQVYYCAHFTIQRLSYLSKYAQPRSVGLCSQIKVALEPELALAHSSLKPLRGEIKPTQTWRLVYTTPSYTCRFPSQSQLDSLTKSVANCKFLRIFCRGHLIHLCITQFSSILGVHSW